MSNWQKVKIGEFLVKSSTRASELDNYSEIEVLGVSNKLGITTTSHVKSKDLSNYLLIKENYFAYNPYRINVGSIGLTPKGVKGLVSPAYVVFTTDERLKSEILFDYLKSFDGLQQINKLARGTVRKALRYDDLCEIEMMIPTIERQVEILQHKKIVKKITDSLSIQITHQQNLLKKLRQAILQEAIEGKLTKDWRKENPDVEPASVLLEKIKAEKARLVAEKKIKKTKPLPPIEKDEIPFEIPETWELCRLGDICSKTGSGSTPRGGKTVYTKSGIKFIRSQNVYNNGLMLFDIAYITEQIHEKMSSTKVIANDLLLNITGGSIGRCAIVPNDFDGGNINQHVAIIRKIKPLITNYFHNVIISNYFQKRILNAQTGAGREGLPKNKMDLLLIPLPPLAEQNEIVKIVDRLFAMCDELKVQINDSKANADILMQAVLKEAFSN